MSGPTETPASPSVAVAAVIPTYNRAGLVERAIESVLDGTTRPAEILVVDDGSTDDTDARLRRFGHDIRYLRQPNAGGGAARNLGVRQAHTDWVAFLDSDDVWAPDHLERAVSAITRTGGAAELYFADTRRAGGEGGRSLWARGGFTPTHPYELTGDGTDWALLPLQPMMLQSSVVRRSRFLEIGGLDAELTRRHDTDLFLRMSVGRPVCAFTGGGAVMSDEGAAGRLTSIHDGSSRLYWECTVHMYERAARLPLDPEHRRELRSRLAVAHRRLAGGALRDLRFHEAWGHVVACARADRRVLSRRPSRLRLRR